MTRFLKHCFRHPLVKFNITFIIFFYTINRSRELTLGRPGGTFEIILNGYDSDLLEILVMLITNGSLCGLGSSMTNKIVATIWAIENVI